MCRLLQGLLQCSYSNQLFHTAPIAKKKVETDHFALLKP